MSNYKIGIFFPEVYDLKETVDIINTSFHMKGYSVQLHDKSIFTNDDVAKYDAIIFHLGGTSPTVDFEQGRKVMLDNPDKPFYSVYITSASLEQKAKHFENIPNLKHIQSTEFFNRMISKPAEYFSSDISDKLVKN